MRQRFAREFSGGLPGVFGGLPEGCRRSAGGFAPKLEIHRRPAPAVRRGFWTKIPPAPPAPATPAVRRGFWTEIPPAPASHRRRRQPSCSPTQYPRKNTCFLIGLCFPCFPGNLSRKSRDFQQIFCLIKFKIHGFLATFHAVKPKTQSSSGTTYFSRTIGVVRNGKKTSPFP